MSKKRNTNKVRKALKRKRDRLWHGAKPQRGMFGRGSQGNSMWKAALAAWEQVHKTQPDDPRKPPPKPDPDPDP